jgi:thioredoxin 1
MVLLLMAGVGAAWLAWRKIKIWLRRRIQVEDFALASEKPTLLYFSSTDCVPCRSQQSPIIASLSQVMGQEARFQEYDALDHPDLARRYQVLTVPTMVVVSSGGDVVAVNYGVTQAEKLRRQLISASGA